MRKKILYCFLLLSVVEAQLNGQNPIPLSVTIEDMDLSVLNKKDQTKWQPKILKFSEPVFASDCTPEQQTFNRTVIAYGRTVVASKGFEDLLRRRMREAYGKCTGDPFYDSNLEAQINQVLAVCRAPKTIKINCTGGSGNASTGIGGYDLNKTPEIWWGGWFQGVSQCAIQNNCTWAPFPWPYSQAAGIIWHELMHQYGYGHGANNPDENNIAKTNCGIPASNTTWHFQANTVPYIVGNCVSEMIDESQRAYGDIRNCPSPNQIKLVDRVGGTTCSCVNDPGKKGLGILELKNGKLSDVAMLGDNDWIGGWHYNSPDNKIVGSGDFDGDGNRDFILYSNWGIGIVTYKKPNWRPLLVKPNGTWFGGWNFNATQNTVAGTGDFNGDGKDDILIQSSWGLGILTFDGSSSLISLMAQPRNTWFGSWRWDATVNPGRDKIQMVADLNKDGKADILVTSSWGIGLLTLVGNSINAYVAKPNGTRFGGWNFNSADNSFAGSGDFNGDGKNDVVIQSPWGLGLLTFDGVSSLSALMMNPRDTWFGTWRWDATVNAGRDKIQGVGDFNGDGKADLLVTSSWGVGILTLNNTTMNAYMTKPNGTRFGAWNFNSGDNQIVGIADFDNDRKKDIVIRSPWGIGVLALNGQNNTLNSLDMQPYKSFLGSWVIENTDKTIGVGNFEKSTNNHELLIQKN
jgi:FG-GAP-like repeat